MGQRYEIKGSPRFANSKRSADDFIELFEGEELRDRQFADRDDQVRLKQRYLVIHPG